jgi:hypothetical protein
LALHLVRRRIAPDFVRGRNFFRDTCTGWAPFLVYRLIGFSIPHDNEGAPSFCGERGFGFALGAKGGSSRT